MASVSGGGGVCGGGGGGVGGERERGGVGGGDSKEKVDWVVSVLVPTAAVGLIIGKSGQFLKAIVADSGATLRLQSHEDMPTGARERGLVIIGSSASIRVAIKMIMLKLQTRLPSTRPEGEEASGGSIEDENNSLVQWIIPQSSTGLLIGKQGAGIKMINEKSGAWVKVAHVEESMPGEGERLVYIRGTQAQTTAALSIVRRIAGGRAAIVAVPVEAQDRTTTRIPRRAVTEVLNGNEALGTASMSSAFPDVRIEIDPLVLTGLSENIIFLHGPEIARLEAEAMIRLRVSDWTLRHSSPTLTPRERGEEEMRNDDPAKMEVEMCIVILIAAEHAPSLVEKNEEGVSVLTAIEARTGIITMLLPAASESPSKGCAVRSMCLIGSLRALLSGLEKIQHLLHNNTLHAGSVPRLPLQLPSSNQPPVMRLEGVPILSINTVGGSSSPSSSAQIHHHSSSPLGYASRMHGGGGGGGGGGKMMSGGGGGDMNFGGLGNAAGVIIGGGGGGMQFVHQQHQHSPHSSPHSSLRSHSSDGHSSSPIGPSTPTHMQQQQHLYVQQQQQQQQHQQQHQQGSHQLVQQAVVVDPVTGMVEIDGQLYYRYDQQLPLLPSQLPLMQQQQQQHQHQQQHHHHHHHSQQQQQQQGAAYYAYPPAAVSSGDGSVVYPAPTQIAAMQLLQQQEQQQLLLQQKQQQQHFLLLQQQAQQQGQRDAFGGTAYGYSDASSGGVYYASSHLPAASTSAVPVVSYSPSGLLVVGVPPSPVSSPSQQHHQSQRGV